MKLAFTPVTGQKPGLIVGMLQECYAALLAGDAELWKPELAGWQRYEREVFLHPNTVGSCIYLSWVDDEMVGFASYDPRQKPLGIVGHNCILPGFQGNGYGQQQMRELLRRLSSMGFERVEVSTLDHSFFGPARQMYLACGFREQSRTPWEADSSQLLIAYSVELGPVNTIRMPSIGPPMAPDKARRARFGFSK